MASSRSSLQDRLLKGAVPRPVPGFVPPPRELCPDVWVLDRQLRHFGLARLPTRTAIVRLEDETVAIVSPPSSLDARSAEAIEAIGPVRIVVVPNTFHYLFTGEAARRFPGASVWGAPGLRNRAPGLRLAGELGPEPPGEWPSELAYAVLGPVRGLSEVLLFHRSSGTLFVTDLAFNVQQYPRHFDRLFWRCSGIPAHFGPGRTSRSLLLRDRDVASRCLSRAARWPIRRIVVAHGDAIERDAAARFRQAFAEWLP
jgi:hypothetical protein